MKTLLTAIVTTLVILAVALLFGGGASATTPQDSSKILYGALRDSGDGTGFEPIHDSGHLPSHIDYVTTTKTAITIHYGSLHANIVGTLLVEPDETFAKLGLVCGASVGFTDAVIHCYANGKPVDLTTLTTEKYPYSNLWIYGVFQ